MIRIYVMLAGLGLASWHPAYMALVLTGFGSPAQESSKLDDARDARHVMAFPEGSGYAWECGRVLIAEGS